MPIEAHEMDLEKALGASRTTAEMALTVIRRKEDKGYRI